MTDAIFIDAVGVLLDPTVMAPQWRRLIGEFLAPRLGGEQSAWAAANAYAADRMFARYRDPGGTPRETHGRLRRLWLREMCEHVGVQAPKDAGVVAEEASRWVTERVSAAAPGAIEAVRALHSRGHRLFTASAHVAADVDGYLRAIELRELFDETYGSDLIDRWKTNAGYYRKLLEHAAVRAEDAVTVDDQERCLDWAKRAGFRTFLLAPAGGESSHEVIASLGELGARLGRS